MPGHFIRSAILTGAIPLMAEFGQDARALAEDLGMDAAALSDPDVPVTVRQVLEFFTAAARLCGCPNFGLMMASRGNITILGPLWILLRQAQTFEQMLRDLAGNFDLYTNDVSVALLDWPGGKLMTWTAGRDTGDEELHGAEYSLGVTCLHLRSYAPARWHPSMVCFRHAKPRDMSVHHRIFGPNVIFDQDHNGIFLEDEVLAFPLASSASRNRALLARILRLDGVPRDLGLIEQVDAIVRVMLPYTHCDVITVSETIGMAPRTLQDHLQAQGTSFKAVKDAVRADLARKYLTSSSLSLTQIADILGYSEVSAFSRSFRRWYGRPASAERRARRRGAPTRADMRAATSIPHFDKA